MSVVGMNEPARDEAVILIVVGNSRRIKDEIVHDLLIAERGNRNKDSDDDNNDRDRQL